MSSMSTGQEKRAQPPLAVPPLEAARLLSLGMSHLYELMRTGELVSYRDGRARRITMASIQEHMARQLAADSAESDGWQQINPRPPSTPEQRRRKRA